MRHDSLHDRMKVKVELVGDADQTVAEAHVKVGGREYVGRGSARRNPHDPNVPMIGEELAMARALAELSHQLLDAAAEGIERFEGHPVTLTG